MQILVDMILCHDNVDWDDVTEKCAKSNFKDLPGDLSLKVEPQVP